MDAMDKRSVLGSLASLMEQRLGECSATDLSRLAWLHLHAGDTVRARELSERGLEREPGNIYCEKLYSKLRYEA